MKKRAAQVSLTPHLKSGEVCIAEKEGREDRVEWPRSGGRVLTGQAVMAY